MTKMFYLFVDRSTCHRTVSWSNGRSIHWIFIVHIHHWMLSWQKNGRGFLLWLDWLFEVVDFICHNLSRNVFITLQSSGRQVSNDTSRLIVDIFTNIYILFRVLSWPGFDVILHFQYAASANNWQQWISVLKKTNQVEDHDSTKTAFWVILGWWK